MFLSIAARSAPLGDFSLGIHISIASLIMSVLSLVVLLVILCFVLFVLLYLLWIAIMLFFLVWCFYHIFIRVSSVVCLFEKRQNCWKNVLSFDIVCEKIRPSIHLV